MRIADLLRRKGPTVTTVTPETTMPELLGRLAEQNVGALVVVDGDGIVAGIVSERDIVRRLHERGGGLLSGRVREIMTTDVVTCTPQDSVDELSVLMTERRVRHIPVVTEGRLSGIVSIGDVVKSRLDELQQNQEQLEAYIVGGAFPAAG